jgi:hypothetical protein
VFSLAFSQDALFVAGLVSLATPTDPPTPYVLKLTSAGGIDPTYAATGTFSPGFATTSWVVPWLTTTQVGLVVDGSGRAVVGSTRLYASPATDTGNFALSRFSADGTIDGSFGNGGTAEFSASPLGDGARFLALDARGRILAVGVGTFAGNPDVVVARFKDDGTLDAASGR